jgi:hypothetical protein
MSVIDLIEAENDGARGPSGAVCIESDGVVSRVPTENHPECCQEDPHGLQLQTAHRKKA